MGKAQAGRQMARHTGGVARTRIGTRERVTDVRHTERGTGAGKDNNDEENAGANKEINGGGAGKKQGEGT